MKCAVGDFRLCVEEANAFLRVAEWCNEDDAANFLLGGMYPFAVNAAFSCELYLKAIFIYYSPKNEFPCGHKLDELFALLPNDIQKKLTDEYSTRCSEELSSFLEVSKDAFVKWRYALVEGVSINISAILAFANTLRDYVKSLQ